MTERMSDPPHDLINGTEHFWLWDWKPVACEVVDGGWKVPGFQTPRSTAEMQAEGWWYVGPSPTSEEAAASVADARRFRWLAEKSIPFFNGFQLHAESEELDIRAAIDAEMGEKR